MTNLKTDQALLEALHTAASVALSADEIHEQRVSFIMGTLKDSSTVSREKVSRVLAVQEGKDGGK